MEKVGFGLTGMERLGMEEVGFVLTGIAWTGGNRFGLTGLEWKKLVLA
jgi:hypothetical protein